MGWYRGSTRAATPPFLATMSPPKEAADEGTERQEEEEKVPRIEDYGGSILPEERHGVIINGWRLESMKKPILNCGELEQ